VELDLQQASEEPGLPDAEQLRAWAAAAAGSRGEEAQLSLRIVDEEEMRALNLRYRRKDAPTNVLAFPYEDPAGVGPPLLGDIVICAPVVRRQAAQQGKAFHDHFAHMVVHGCLHLLGRDHADAQQAREMEDLEIRILRGFEIANPYEEN
jgi:probable rRNA maturation factor